MIQIVIALFQLNLSSSIFFIYGFFFVVVCDCMCFHSFDARSTIQMDKLHNNPMRIRKKAEQECALATRLALAIYPEPEAEM